MSIERFVLNDLPDNTWSVCWPGYEEVVVNNTRKAHNLLKILFEEVGVTEAVLAVYEYSWPQKPETMHINEAAWYQDAEGSSKYVTEFHVVAGCKFETLEQAEKFKLIMERRLAWRRLSNRTWE